MSDPVLIVDDSLTIRMDLAEAFAAAGFETLPCATLAEAREVLGATRVSIVLLDVVLPDGDGVEFLREIRASRRYGTVAVLMLSSEAEVKDRIRALQTGADEYVGKPYDPTYVVAKARELLQTRGSQPPDPQSTVLIIDDDTTFRGALRGILEQAGYAVMSSSSGEDGLRLAARRPHAILVDGMLPGIDGPTVIRRIRLDEALRAVPCMLLTSSEERESELRALEAGADAFAKKDDGADVILAKLTALLRRPAVGAADVRSILGPQRVLAVDDSPTYLQALSASLRHDGYEVICAHSGEEALELLAVQNVDCALVDLIMPGMGGEEVCRRIKAAPGVRDTPLLIMTALDDRAAILQGLAAGADDYIPKSSEFEVLKARVRAQIRRKQLADEERRVREELLRRELVAAEARAARALAETRAQLIEELERKNSELEAFSYSVSHDLRAPLRSIDGFSQALLEDHLDKLDAEGQNYLHRVRTAAQRMAELIDDLLELSRVSRTEVRRESFDLSALAADVGAELRRRDPERQLELVIEPAMTVNADPRLMRIVLENLLGNAWKFTRDVARAEVHVGRITSGDEQVYFVRDNGAGFDPAYGAKLFRPFQRLHTEQQFPGTGIGLATTYRVVDRHGGRIWAESSLGKGATFHFTLARKAGWIEPRRVDP